MTRERSKSKCPCFTFLFNNNNYNSNNINNNRTTLIKLWGNFIVAYRSGESEETKKGKLVYCIQNMVIILKFIIIIIVGPFEFWFSNTFFSIYKIIYIHHKKSR